MSGSPGRGSSLLPTLLLVACAFGALAPAWTSSHLLADRYDWRYFDAMGEISRRSVAWYHEAPLWNPYSCGGEVALANPQSLDAAPTFLLVVLFGVALGYKLAFAFYIFCALDGTRRLALRLGISATGSLLSALGFGLSGYCALRFSEGQVTFIGITLFPYLLLFFDRSLDEIEWAIPTGIIAAWIALLGGTFTPPMAAQVLLLWAVMAVFKRRTIVPIALLGLAGMVALTVGAVRMLPVLEFVHAHPRPPFMRAVDRSGPWHLLWDLVAWRTFGPLDFNSYNSEQLVPKAIAHAIAHAFERKYWSHEYAARLPFGLLFLWPPMLFWLAWSKRLDPALRWSARRASLLTIYGALLSMGNFARFAPWSLLQKLPVMRDLRVPSRHLVIVLLGLALLSGIGWDHAARLIAARWPDRKRLVPRLGLALILLCAVDGVVYSALTWRGIFTVWIPIPDEPTRFYHDDRGDWRTMRDHLFQGHGSLGCDEEAPLQRAEALDPGNVAQERLLDPAAGEVVASEWSPNRRIVTVDLQRPTTLLVNSNWNEHWTVDRGAVTKVAGRLAVDLAGSPPGRSTFTLRYSPRSFPVGAAITALALPLLALLFGFARRRRRRT